jgi:hypothetical protein
LNWFPNQPVSTSKINSHLRKQSSIGKQNHHSIPNFISNAFKKTSKGYSCIFNGVVFINSRSPFTKISKLLSVTHLVKYDQKRHRFQFYFSPVPSSWCKYRFHWFFSKSAERASSFKL